MKEQLVERKNARLDIQISINYRICVGYYCIENISIFIKKEGDITDYSMGFSMTDYTKKFPCGECEKMVMATEKHTYNDCIEWKRHLKTQVTL